MPLPTRLIGAAILFAPTSLIAKNEMKIHGSAEVGFNSESYKRGEATHEAKVQFETKRKNGLKAVIELEGEHDEEGIVLKDVYIDSKSEIGDETESSIRFGQTKKVLGLEYHNSSKDRLGIDRSFVYQRLEEFGYMGREILFRYERETKNGTSYSISGGYSASIDANIILHTRTKDLFLGIDGGVWILLQSDRTDSDKQFVWASTWSLWKKTVHHDFELELFYGIDPFENQVSKTFGNGRSITFAASKFQYGYRIQTSDQTTHEPFIQLGSYQYDTKVPQYNSLIAMVGWNYYPLEELKIAINFEIIANNSTIDLDERSYDQSGIKFSSKYSF